MYARPRCTVARASAGNVEQVPLDAVDLLQIRVIPVYSIPVCRGMTSSLQAVTATTLNSRPLPRWIVLTARPTRHATGSVVAPHAPYCRCPNTSRAYAGALRRLDAWLVV